MLGAAGALLCMTAGTALGMAVKERRYARLKLLEEELELLMRLRLMLIEERLGLCELLTECAGGPSAAAAGALPKRLLLTAHVLQTQPLLGLNGAYRQACREVPIPWEGKEEQEALSGFFDQLGVGTAAMREQSAAGCMRRLKPLAESARAKAEKSGRLCMQLGLLLGLMAGIALW